MSEANGSRFVGVGDSVQFDMKLPYEHSVILKLTTVEQAAHANEMIMSGSCKRCIKEEENERN